MSFSQQSESFSESRKRFSCEANAGNLERACATEAHLARSSSKSERFARSRK